MDRVGPHVRDQPVGIGRPAPFKIMLDGLETDLGKFGVDHIRVEGAECEIKSDSFPDRNQQRFPWIQTVDENRIGRIAGVRFNRDQI